MLKLSIGKELFNDTLEKLDDLDRAKYFEFAGEAFHIADNVVDHFSTDDVKLLADSIVPILETVKSITQPEMMQAVKGAIVVFNSIDTENIPEVSAWKAMKELNTPEMKRGLGFLITFLKNMANYEQVTDKGE